MAGEQLYDMMASRGGSDSDYADVVYGVVTKVTPLKVQLSNSMVLTDSFITLGKHIGKYKLKGKVTKHAESKVKGDIEIEIDNSLKVGDKVTMIRGDGGQQFYLIEREGK